MYTKLHPSMMKKNTATKTLLILVPSFSALELGAWWALYIPEHSGPFSSFLNPAQLLSGACNSHVDTDGLVGWRWVGIGNLQSGCLRKQWLHIQGMVEREDKGLHIYFQLGLCCFLQHKVGGLSTVWILQLCLVASQMVEILSVEAEEIQKCHHFYNGSLRFASFLEYHKCVCWQLAKAVTATNQVSFKIITFSLLLLTCFGKIKARASPLRQSINL